MLDMDKIRDRQDAPIWNAIEANNFKQALKLVDKRLAKKRTDYLEALRVYIRARSPSITEKSAVLAHLEELIGKSPAVLNVDAIDLYDEALGEILPDSRESWVRIIGELRWHYVKSAPKLEDDSLKSFQACLSRDDLDHARQIANSLEKNFPNNHAYIFWNITTMFLYSISPKCPEQQRGIWGGLAHGQMGKLATVTRNAADSKKLPTRAIHTPQELHLLHRVTERYGKPEQVLEFLQDSHLGPESAVAKGEWELWRLKLKLMAEIHQWQDVFETTGALLKRARTRDQLGHLSESRLSDWIVWDAYISSALKLESHEYTDKVRAEVEAHLNPAARIDKSWRRNASLAWVKLHFEISKIPQVAQEDEELCSRVAAVLKYLHEFGHANTAYNDLRKFVEQLTSEESTQLLSILKTNTLFRRPDKVTDDATIAQDGTYPTDQDLSTADDITRAVNTYKLRYLLTCSRPENERRQSAVSQDEKSMFLCTSCKNPCGTFCRGCLGVLVQNGVHSYKIALDDDGKITKNLLTTDRHPADDLCLLSAMCLVKLSLIGSKNSEDVLRTPRTSFLLQATALLEFAWTHSKSNFQISLILVRLYSYLGCGSLAARAYQRLAMKQIQVDTLSYTLFDRISTLHPHPFSHSPDGVVPYPSPLEQLSKHQKFYKSAVGQINKNVWLSFKHGSYNSIFEIREVAERLFQSMSAVMSVIESRKASRLVETNTPLMAIPNDHYGLIPDSQDPKTVFNNTNDYESFPSFELSKGPIFEDLSRFFPGPSNYRYRMNLFAEKLMLILNLAPEGSGEKDMLMQWLKKYLGSQKQQEFGTEHLTRSEDLANRTYHSMATLILEACDNERWDQPDFQERLDSQNAALVDNLTQHVAVIEGMQDLVPAFFSTLHALYAAHEVGKTATNFCSFLQIQGKGTHQKQSETNKKVKEVAHQLLQVVTEKCATVKKGLDEGGWIDKVLESVLPDIQEASDGENTGVAPIIGTFKELMEENFMEEWAGQVVESWRDSVSGFSYIMAPSKD